jgi:hypothetical protein
MRRSSLIAGMLAVLCGPAEGQSMPTDLHGAVVETTSFHEQVIRRAGKEYPHRQRIDMRIAITSDNKIQGWSISTGFNEFGTSKGKQLPISSTLHRPGSSHNVGGGDRVWILQGSKLIHLYVYKGGGAIKKEITFSRSGGGLACSFQESFARENGVGPITWESSVDGARITLVKSKQVSTTCRVSKAQ